MSIENITRNLLAQADRLSRHNRQGSYKTRECFRIDTAAAEKALRDNEITIRGKGYSDFQASKQVSLRLGHKRTDVTRIYLASLKKDGGGNV